MINATAEYALRAVVYLAASDAKAVRRDELADQTQVPSDYLAKVMRSLDAAGIIGAQRGPGGGYHLQRDPTDLSVYDVITAVSPLARIEKCPLGIQGHVDLCPLHARLDEAVALTETALRSTTIAELVTRQGVSANCEFPPNKEGN